MRKLTRSEFIHSYGLHSLYSVEYNFATFNAVWLSLSLACSGFLELLLEGHFLLCRFAQFFVGDDVDHDFLDLVLIYLL